MKAMVLAAGYGTRLLPLTRQLPKPLFPVMNQPLLGHTLGWLRAAGVGDVTVNLHHLPDQIIAAFTGISGLGIHFSLEEKILGTAGGIKQAERFLGGGAFFVVNSDILSDVDLARVMAFHRNKGACLTLVVRQDPVPERYGLIEIDAKGRVTHFLGANAPHRPDTQTRVMFTGVQVMETEVLQRIPAGRFSGTAADIFPAMVEEGLPVYACLHEGYWLDLGTRETYLQAHRDALQGTLRLQGEIPFARGPGIAGPVAAGRDLSIDAGANIGPHVVLGDRCRVAAGASMENSVCWDDVIVGKGAQVERSILGHGAVVPPGERVLGKVVVGA
ncbi:MAG: NDP-sugar synthase [Nitrospinaceae bacterium]|jgi:NDP-sugar pyrophosphorylase family protein|nr:MAG: NDP-sugar synthase [Nitrospinaceae bacterium]